MLINIQPNVYKRLKLKAKRKVAYVGYLLYAIVLLTTRISLQPSDITINLTSGNSVLVDNNKGCSVEPHAAFISFEICNTTNANLENLFVVLEDFSNPLFGLAGGQSAVQEVGTIETGGCVTYFWYIYYDCSTIGASSDVSMKLYNVTGDTIVHTENIITISTIDAGAGGRILGSQLADDFYLGEAVTINIEYSLGNIKAGSPIIVQPAGNLDFNADCFQLVGSEVIYSEITDIAIGTQNQLFFDNLSKHTGNSHNLHLSYTFVVACNNTDTTTLKAYSASVSGANYKRYNIGEESYSNGPTLEIALENFKVQFQNSSALLSWEIAKLEGGTKFTIQRSIDASSFESLADIVSGNTDQDRGLYSYDDPLPMNLLEGPIFYRVKHTDHNGEISYSHIQKLERNLGRANLTLSPNPTQKFVEITYENIDLQGTTLSIFNTQGKLIYSHQITEDSFSNLRVNLASHPRGIYFVQLKNANHHIVRPLQLQ